MSLVRKFLLSVGGAAVLVTGVASTAQAQVAIGTNPCHLYAHEYAAAHAPHFGFRDWDAAYHYAYNACLAGGPTFAAAPAYPGPFALAGAVLAAPLHVAGAAVHAGTTLAGAALSAPATVAAGTAAALAPPATAPAVSPTAEPVVRKNYRGTYELPQ